MKIEEIREKEREWMEVKGEIKKFLKKKCEATAEEIMEYLVANYRIEKLVK